MGISVIVVSTASVSYMKYLRKSKQAALILSAQDFMKGAKACFAVSEDDKGKCDTASELKFSCSNCTVVPHKTANRVSFRMDTDDLKVCAVYRPDCERRVNGIAVSWKVCTVQRSIQCDDALHPANHLIPTNGYKECFSDNDCKTGQKCSFISDMKGERGPNDGCGLGHLPPP